MTAPPGPSELRDRAVDEGRRRLDQSPLELVSTGFTVIFGIIALAIVAAIEADRGWLVGPLFRLWVVTFVLDLVGGVGFVTFAHGGQATGARESGV